MPDLESKLWFLDRKKITILSHDTDRDFGLINLSDGTSLFRLCRYRFKINSQCSNREGFIGGQW